MTRTGRAPGSPLQAEALAIASELGLADMLRYYGKARLVGSVALDLIVQRDIDFHLLIGGSDPAPVAIEIRRRLAGHPRAPSVHIHDYMPDGLKVGIDDYAGPSGPWSIDIWVTCRSETVAFDLLDDLQARLMPEHRQLIMAIKGECVRRGKEPGLSHLIYEAVVDHGVTTIEAFDDYRASLAAKQDIQEEP
jgi:hypothetical protein